MTQSFVLTFVGPDQPGLVEKIARVVHRHGGNWLESRMSQLAGQFAGIARVSIEAQNAGALQTALEALSDGALTVVVRASAAAMAASDSEMTLNILGPDRPGIVQEVSHALASCGINLLEMDTRVSSAPMSAEALFEADARVAIPAGLDLPALEERLDDIANRLSVDIALEPCT